MCSKCGSLLPPQHKKVRSRRTARQKGSSSGLEVGCNYQQTFQHWRSAPADCCGRNCRTKSHRRQNAADVEVIRRVLDTAVDCGCAVSAGLAAAGQTEYKGGCVAAGECTRVHEECFVFLQCFRGQCFVFLLVFC